MVKETQPSKKKPKTEVVINDADIYKKVVQFESRETEERTTEKDAETYLKFSEDIRQLMGDIFKMKKDESSSSSNQIRSKSTDACLKIVGLKKINRLLKFRTILDRAKLAHEKQIVDSTNLQLQNLLYELAHIVNEWNKCEQYKSKDADIELVSVDEYLEAAPPEMKVKFQNYAKEKAQRDDSVSHDLHMAMLEYELNQRKHLSQLCNTLQEKKQLLADNIVTKRTRLESLAPQLAQVLEATRPLQETLGMPVDRIRAEYKTASLLPDCLHMLYCSANSYNNVYKVGIETEIVGDIEAAQQWTDTVDAVGDIESDSERDNQDRIDKNRRHHRQPSASSNNAMSNGDCISEDHREIGRKLLLRAHPLGVNITFKTGTQNVLIKLLTKYRPKLKIVTVTAEVDFSNSNISGASAQEVLFGDVLLNKIFPDDCGTVSPNPHTYFQLHQVGYGDYETMVDKIGYAYNWAQNMCGLEFPQTQKNVKCSKPLSLTTVEHVINAINNRLRCRIKLAIQLMDLDASALPPAPTSSRMPKPSATDVQKWSTLSFDRLCEQHKEALSLVETGIISRKQLFYSMTLNQQKSLLYATVIIDHDYPKVMPVFLLRIAKQDGTIYHCQNNEDVRDMERAVNIECVCNLEGSQKYFALSIQLQYLSVCFDIYRHTLSEYGHGSSNPNITFLRRVGSRTRRKPFTFRNIGSGIFTQ